jgi:hypothetical protein
MALHKQKGFHSRKSATMSSGPTGSQCLAPFLLVCKRKSACTQSKSESKGKGTTRSNQVECWIDLIDQHEFVG